MTDLEVRFVAQKDITPELDRQIDALDKLAFANEDIELDPVLSSIHWTTPDWMALGYLNEKLVTQLCLPHREIMVGSEKVWVAGIGGMATHPDFQRRGFGLSLLEKTSVFMRDEMHVLFGLLICADETIPFYERAGWRKASDELYFTQDNMRRALKTCVMTVQLTDRPWISGKIDLCGLPW